jgi:hypothetical protein
MLKKKLGKFLRFGMIRVCTGKHIDKGAGTSILFKNRTLLSCPPFRTLFLGFLTRDFYPNTVYHLHFFSFIPGLNSSWVANTVSLGRLEAEASGTST